MKTHLLPALKLTAVMLILTVPVYTAIVWGFSQLVSPNKGNGEVVSYSMTGKTSGYGFSNIGQKFTDDKYFQSRPSAVDYNAAASGASNKAAGNTEYLAMIHARIDTLLTHNPTVKKENIPVEMVTASGSGLDPDITLQSALIQVDRIASIRQIEKSKLILLIQDHLEKPMLGIFGPEKINVLKLNIALDATSSNN